jgi:hypothetical protein
MTARPVGAAGRAPWLVTGGQGLGSGQPGRVERRIEPRDGADQERGDERPAVARAGTAVGAAPMSPVAEGVLPRSGRIDCHQGSP